MINIRKAQENDIAFVIEAILEAEKSGTDKISYCVLLNISEEKMRDILDNILRQEIEGCDFSLKSFLIASVNSEPVGAISAWVEGSQLKSSANIKAQCLKYYLGLEKWIEAQSNLEALGEINIDREEGALQIESVYVDEKFRGKRIVSKLILFAIQNYRSFLKVNPKLQIITALDNLSSHKAFKNAGLSLSLKKVSKNIKLSSIFNSSGKILWEMKLK